MTIQSGMAKMKLVKIDQRRNAVMRKVEDNNEKIRAPMARMREAAHATDERRVRRVRHRLAVTHRAPALSPDGATRSHTASGMTDHVTGTISAGGLRKRRKLVTIETIVSTADRLVARQIDLTNEVPRTMRSEMAGQTPTRSIDNGLVMMSLDVHKDQPTGGSHRVNGPRLRDNGGLGQVVLPNPSQER